MAAAGGEADVLRAWASLPASPALPTPAADAAACRVPDCDITAATAGGEEQQAAARWADRGAVRRAADTFLGSGLCWFDGALAPAAVTRCQEKATEHLALMRRALAARGSGGGGHGSEPVDFAELVARDGSRLDLRHRMDEPPFSGREVVFNPLWYPLAQQVRAPLRPSAAHALARPAAASTRHTTTAVQVFCRAIKHRRFSPNLTGGGVDIAAARRGRGLPALHGRDDRRGQ